MRIGKIIRDLRREKGMTQEVLAEKLNISVSAISQWEMEKTMPDISMIPLLVDIFEVSSDELLGIHSEKTDLCIKEYIQKSNELYHSWKHEDMVTLMEQAYREFPSNMEIVNAYAFALEQTLSAFPERMNLCIELNKKILDRSLDDKLRFNAVFRLCRCFSQKGDRESVAYYVQKLPSGPHMCAPNMMRKYDLFANEEKLSAYQEGVELLIWLLGEYVMSIADPNYQNPCCTFTVEHRVQILEQMIDVIKIVYGEENACDMNNDLYEYHRIIGALYLFAQDTEKAIAYFEKAYEYAVKFKCSYTDGDCYTSPLFIGFEARHKSDWSDGANSPLEELYERFTTQSRYDVLKNDPRFVLLKSNIEKAIAVEL